MDDLIGWGGELRREKEMKKDSGRKEKSSIRRNNVVTKSWSLGCNGNEQRLVRMKDVVEENGGRK